MVNIKLKYNIVETPRKFIISTKLYFKRLHVIENMHRQHSNIAKLTVLYVAYLLIIQ